LRPPRLVVNGIVVVVVVVVSRDLLRRANTTERSTRGVRARVHRRALPTNRIESNRSNALDAAARDDVDDVVGGHSDIR
jgi:hypothetical protein